MSKVDAQRALRDARYARFAAAKKAEESAVASRKPARAKTPEMPAAEELFAAPAVTKVTAKPAKASRAKGKPEEGSVLSELAPSLGDSATDEESITETSTTETSGAHELSADETSVAEAAPSQAFSAGEVSGVAQAAESGAPVASTAVEASSPVEVNGSVEAPAIDDETEAHEELCGHRSMNGKSCTRDKGHPQKNHRYN